MPTYIMLSSLSPDGVQTIKNNPSRIREVNREVEQLGATVKAQWATLGQFDFVNVVEAPDVTTMARVSLELGSRDERASACTIACSRAPPPTTSTRIYKTLRGLRSPVTLRGLRSPVTLRGLRSPIRSNR